MAALLHRLWPQPRLFAPDAPFPAGPPQGLAVFAPGAIPSVDYYFRSRAKTPGAPPILWVDTLAQDPRSLPAGSLEGHLAVIVRHAPRAWLRWLQQETPRLAGTAFFLDDDLPGAARDPWLPTGYALRTSLRFRSVRGLLARQCGQVWAANAALALRYPEAGARVLPPLAFAATRAPQPEGPLTIFYHGTAAHGREKRWLAQVAAGVQARLADSVFEVCGGPELARLYAGVPRLRVVPQLPWPKFRARLFHQALHIGLAPLLDSPFNATRSHTKFLEISSCGAAGVYSRAAPYADVVRHGDTGLLADNDPEAWIGAILRLAEDSGLRLRLAAAAQAWAASQPRLWPWESP